VLFNSIAYLIFFPVVVLAHFALPHRARWAMLVAASCYFYMFFIPKYILVLFAIILLDFVAALFIERSEGSRRKAWLVASIAANLGLLAVFKYYGFLTANVGRALDLAGADVALPKLDLILPIGLSFHTFQSLAYTIEVYRGRYTAERHLGYYALYVLYFPQMVAGPIERPEHVLPQLKIARTFDAARTSRGLRLILLGLVKKMLIADNLAPLVNAAYGSYREHSGLALLLATLFFSVQIYCDFSGYSDIAVGSSSILGIELMRNFDHPYASTSISEFWRRWHISLSSWFRDYLYLPLGGSREGRAKTLRNIFVVFGLSGLWHGANWTYVIWGLLHGTYLGVERAIRARAERFGLPKTPSLLAGFTTFALATIAWVFFRASNLAAAIGILKRIALGRAGKDLDLLECSAALVLSSAILIGGLVLNRARASARLADLSTPLRWSIYLLLVASLVLFGSSEGGQFIYFQF
jgi:alginate O-acetyltransferase complex protein AlgI